MPEKLIIAGGGHSSLPLIKMGNHWKRNNLAITLISAESFLVYSGALPQFMGGFYNWEQTTVDLKGLCKTYGVEFHQDKVSEVNKSEKTVITTGGKEIGYDYLVINLGVITSKSTDSANYFPVKPMPELIPLREKLSAGSINNLLIAGAGAAGTEIALNLSHPESKTKISGKITLIDTNSRILSTFPGKVSRFAENRLKARNVNIKTETKFDDNSAENFDAVIVATGNLPVSSTVRHDFETLENGRIAVNPSLLIKGERSVFAAGDTANIPGRNYPQIGVHAVKQGILLRKNIKLLLDGKKLNNYRPYPVNPLIISDGPDNAILIAGKISISGKLQSALKHSLDMNWIEKYRLPSDQRKSWFKLFVEGMNRKALYSR